MKNNLNFQNTCIPWPILIISELFGHTIIQFNLSYKEDLKFSKSKTINNKLQLLVYYSEMQIRTDKVIDMDKYLITLVKC